MRTPPKPQEQIVIPEYILFEDDMGRQWSIETLTGQCTIDNRPANFDTYVGELIKLVVAQRAQLEMLCNYIEEMEMQVEAYEAYKDNVDGSNWNTIHKKIMKDSGID